MSAPTPPSGPEHFTPPPAEPASHSAARANLVLAGLLSGIGCALVLLAVVALVIVLAGRSNTTGADGMSVLHAAGSSGVPSGPSHPCGRLLP